MLFCFLFIRNKSIRNIRLKLGKNYETYKKHRQAEFHVITLRNVFSRKFVLKLKRK